MGLRVGGLDQYSRWHREELVTAVGVAGVALIDAAFPDQAAEAIKARETALRWMVRGLAAQLAIRKVQVEKAGAGEPATRPDHIVLWLHVAIVQTGTPRGDAAHRASPLGQERARAKQRDRKVEGPARSASVPWAGLFPGEQTC
jgi:hypothetical protein